MSKKNVDVYEGLGSSHQSFNAIGLLEAASGDIVLRGRDGQRDVIFTLDRAIEKYDHTMEVVRKYALHGVHGWDTLAEIADTLKAKILESYAWRESHNVEVSQKAKDFKDRFK